MPTIIFAANKLVNPLGEVNDDPRVVIGNAIQGALGILGSLALATFIYGGFVWMTARGSEEKVGDARKIIVNSSLGLAVVMLAYLITWFVVYQLGETTGFETGL